MSGKDFEKRKSTSRIILIISTIFFALAIIPGVFIAMMSLMIFDSGISTLLILFYSLIATFPVICLLSFASWIFYKFKKYGLAVFISLLPLLNIILIAIMFFVSLMFFGGKLN
jgi:O-antigen/teichoic acid export membrane protein